MLIRLFKWKNFENYDFKKNAGQKAHLDQKLCDILVFSSDVIFDIFLYYLWPNFSSISIKLGTHVLWSLLNTNM